MNYILIKATLRNYIISSALILIVFVTLYSNNIVNEFANRQKESLEKTINSTIITCQLSDIKGKKTNNLNILSSYIEILAGKKNYNGLDLSTAVTNIRTYADFDLVQPVNMKIRKILNFNCDSQLKNSEIVFYENYSEKLFLSEEKVCLVPKEYVCTIGKTIILELDQFDTNKKIEYKIIGTYDGPQKNIIYTPFFSPLINGESLVFTVNKCSFDIKDTSKLEICKNLLFSSEYFVEANQNNISDSLKLGVIVWDENFLKTVEKIEKNIIILEILQPIIITIIIVIGYLSSFLISNTKRRTYSVLRCLGIKKRIILVNVILEYIIYIFAGISILIIIKIIFGGLVFKNLLLIIFSCIAFLFGAIIAAYSVIIKSTLEIVKTEE